VLAKRVKKHKKDQKGFQKRSRLGARKRKTKARSQSLHQKFWAREGYRDFWLCLTELDLPNSAREIDDTDVLLNILEKYLAPLLRSLSQRLLHLALPHGIDIDPYCWIGLNVADPLIQYRRSLYETKTAYFTRRTLSSKKRYVNNFKNHSLLNTMFRFADRSKGDRAQVRLKCSVCSGSSYFIDRTPRYEIATGVYLSRTFKCRSRCASKRVVLFVPFDASIPSKKFNNAVVAYNNAKYREIATNMTFASRTDLEATNSDLLEAWIRAQGFACPKNDRKEAVVDCADKIRLWLENPEDKDDVELPGPARKPRTRVHSVTVDPEEVRCMTDLGGLSIYGLRRWIKSKGWTRRVAGIKSAELLELARRIWNNPEIVRHEVCSRVDLDEMPREHLRTWIRSRGWARDTQKIRKQGLLDLARRIWDNKESFDNIPPALNKVQSREDLEKLSKRTMSKWIRSHGYVVAAYDTLSKEQLLNQACKVWDHLKSTMDYSDDRAEDLKPKQREPTRAIKDSKIPKTCSDLAKMNVNELPKWIRSQGVIIPGLQWTRELLLPLAEKVWAALNDGQPLPKDVRMIRTSPESRSDITHMLGKDLRLWIKSHNVPMGAKVTKTEQVRSLAEQVWDAIQNSTLSDLRNKRSHLRLDKVKVPQTREDLGKMDGRDLEYWIAC